MATDALRWPLHKALAWVLTRDETFTHNAANDDFTPRLPQFDWRRGGDEEKAWVRLHATMCSGVVKVFDARGNRLEVTAIADTDWGFDENGNPCLKKEFGTPLFVLLDRADVTSEFSELDDPISETTENLSWERPTGSGDMPLFHAAAWIGSRQNLKPFFLRDRVTWDRAYTELLPHLVSGDIGVAGRYRGSGLATSVNGVVFSGVEFDLPYVTAPLSLIMVERPHLRCADDELWGTDRRNAEYSHLRVERKDVAKHWPASDLVGADNEDYDNIPQVPLLAAKREATRKALLKKFPTGKVPKTLSARQINLTLRRYYVHGADSNVSDDTISRVLGRK